MRRMDIHGGGREGPRVPTSQCYAFNPQLTQVVILVVYVIPSCSGVHIPSRLGSLSLSSLVQKVLWASAAAAVLAFLSMYQLLTTCPAKSWIGDRQSAVRPNQLQAHSSCAQ